ncbi:MAG: UDP-N-acetylmuramoyl-L-alanyl-D-glutamate--2,6-diaminopimelate ligase [Elusimicrobiota bacterium]
MRLTEILRNIEHIPYGPVDINIKGITYNSKKVRKGFIFVALPGQHVDGRKFIPEAIGRKASVIVSDSQYEARNVTSIVVPNPLASLALLSSNYYRHPDKSLLMIGITGTNGKTTITYFVESILTSLGYRLGVIGTINYRFAGKTMPSSNTTPFSSDLNKMLNEMVSNKSDAVIMEVSSHALAQGRVGGLEFDIAVFTNLTRDHLDYHKTMESYFDEKAKLFLLNLRKTRKNNPKYAIINTDDPWGRKLLEILPQEITTVTYGFNKNAVIRAENVRLDHHGNQFLLVTPAGKKRVILPFIGRHNIYNGLASAAAGLCAGASLDAVVYGIEKTAPVPGRLEKVDAGQPFIVVVDYAHTDDALKNVLSALKQLDPARLITVFGCGGDRDRSKRPVMGEIATRISDFVFITSDNPRSEDPQRIALDIEVGARRQNMNNYQVILEREQAISAAINMAQKGDIVLLAGKGHETYQILGNKTIHFNDSEVAVKHLRDRYS